MKPRVLIVDDEDTIRKQLKSRLERDGHEVTIATQADEAEKAFSSGGPIGCVVTDLKMPGKDGFALTKWVRETHPSARVIVITGHGEKDAAVQALRCGASDYLEKPFDLEEFSHSVSRCLREAQLERENRDLVGRLEARVERLEGKSEDKLWYVSKSPSMAKVNEWLTILRREAMRGEATEPAVLITGESGTGKEGVARMIHAGSRRGKSPWVAVNCANFSEQLLESELFGHEKGAFTGATSTKRGLFEVARGGTLFLDEIAEMDVKLQAKLLRVLQEKSFRRVGGVSDIEADVRVVAATNADLESKVFDASFRADLYHRLNGVMVTVPPLRERTGDVMSMAVQFAERAFRSRGKTFSGFSPEAEEAMSHYGWPGNVRELLNVVERAALVCDSSGPLTPENLSISQQTRSGGNGRGSHLSVIDGGADGASFMKMKKKWLSSFEREYIASTLNRYGGNVSAAAREAQLDRSNFLRLLRRHGLHSGEFRHVGSDHVEPAVAQQASQTVAKLKRAA